MRGLDPRIHPSSRVEPRLNAAPADNGNAPFQSEASHDEHTVTNRIGDTLIGNAER
jgi:hypothetical protein